MDNKELYERLGLNPEATFEEIKKAYKKLASIHHPDKEGGDEEKFKSIAEAYEILSNSEKRMRYDTTGETTNMEDEIKQQKVIQFLQQYILPALMESNHIFAYRETDYSEAISGVFRELNNKLSNSKNTVEKNISNLEKAANRFKYNGDGIDLLSSIISKQKEGQQEALRQIGEQEEFVKECEEFLSAYEFVKSGEKKRVFELGDLNTDEMLKSMRIYLDREDNDEGK